MRHVHHSLTHSLAHTVRATTNWQKRWSKHTNLIYLDFLFINGKWKIYVKNEPCTHAHTHWMSNNPHATAQTTWLTRVLSQDTRLSQHPRQVCCPERRSRCALITRGTASLLHGFLTEYIIGLSCLSNIPLFQRLEEYAFCMITLWSLWSGIKVAVVLAASWHTAWDWGKPCRSSPS